MINGRRLVPFNLNGTVDTNTIPIALLSRVDLLTGGASVAYGADAVAGVVNFNLKKNFTGSTSPPRTAAPPMTTTARKSVPTSPWAPTSMTAAATWC
jgi:outer membrane cobalamin receptor